MLSDAGISVRRDVDARRKRKRQRRRREQITAPKRVGPAADELRQAGSVKRLAYSRRQAAEALAVSVSTIDRRVVPAIATAKTPWGQRLIPVAELERFLVEHLQPGRPPVARRPAGRPPSLPDALVKRVRREHGSGRSLGEIARTLTAERVATAHGGRRWWPSTVRALLRRASCS